MKARSMSALIALALAVVATIACPEAARAAVYGDAVLEVYGSTADLYVVPTGSSVYKKMRPNTWSYEWPAFMRNVRAFHVPSGYVAMNTRTGYGYMPGWHYFSVSNARIELGVETSTCWFLREQMNSPCKIPVPS